MYNSIIISVLAKIWILIICGYKESILKKAVDQIQKIIKFLFNGSFVLGFFTSSRSLIRESFVFHLISKTVDFISLMFKYINRYINKIKQSSVIYLNCKRLFYNEIEILRSFFVFLFFFGIGIILNNIIRGYFSGRSYIIAAAFTISSLVGLALKENYKVVLNSSWTYRFVESIFTIDEGGGNWW